MENTQELEGLQLENEVSGVTQIIGFSGDIVDSYITESEPDMCLYENGVKEASQYIGQFHALINSGMDSDTAILIMSWIREGKLNDDNNKTQVELAKQESIKIKKEML